MLSAARERFLAIFKEMQIPFGYEESCKFSCAHLLTDRCLVSFGREDLCAADEVRSPALTRLLWELGAPAICTNWFAQNQTGAEVIHFGYEADGETIVHKIYLEYVGDARSALTSAEGLQAPVLVHRALKWKAGSNHLRETHYRLMPDQGLTLDQRLAQHDKDAGLRSALALSRAILHKALTRTSEHDMILLDVADVDSPRHSFDLQLYDAQLRLAEVEAPILELGRQLQISTEALKSFFATRSEAVLGHIAAGNDRSGAAFATIYFGTTGQ